MANTNQYCRGEDIVINLQGTEVYDFKKVGKDDNNYHFNLLIYINGLNDKDKNNKNILNLDSNINSYDEWKENKTHGGYVNINKDEDNYGKAICTIPWDSTLNLSIGSYTMEFIWRTPNDVSRNILKKTSAFSIIPSISERVDSKGDLN